MRGQKETTLEAANLVGKRRDRCSFGYREKETNELKKKGVEAKACKEVVLTPKLIMNVYFTVSFIID